MSNLTLQVGANGTGNGNGKPRREYFVEPAKGMYNAIIVDVIDHGFEKNKYDKVAQKISFAFQLAETITEKHIKAAKKKRGLPAKIEEEDKELIGKRLFIRSKRMSFSLFPGGKSMKASDLYTLLSDINGKPLPKGTASNPVNVDLNDYVGRNVKLMISTKPSATNPEIIYTNIAAVMPPDEDDEVLTLDDTYVRVQDRENFTPPPTLEQVEGVAGAAAAGANYADASVQIPFGE